MVPLSARLRAAPVRPRPGDQQVAPQRRERRLSSGRRSHRSGPEAQVAWAAFVVTARSRGHG